MATINCLCQIYPCENNKNKSWIRVDRKRLGGQNSNIPREDTIYVYAPILIGLCKVNFKNEITESNNNLIENNISPINYYGMDTEKFHDESRVATCGRWIVWNNKEKTFNHEVDYKGYWILKFPKDYWDGI